MSGRIYFDHVAVGEDLIEKESSTFNCKIAGTYQFMFSAQTSPSTSEATYVSFAVNDVYKLHLYGVSKNDISYSHLSHTWTYILEEGGKVNLDVAGGKLYTDDDERAYFSGFLIKSNA